jgi:hypothetical protein
MRRKTICTAATLLLVLTGPLLTGHSALAAGDADGLALPASCASVGAASLHAAAPPDAGFDASDFRVRLPSADGAAAPSMDAARLHVTSHGAATPDAALERAAGTSAAALLIALTGNGHSTCPTGLLQSSGDPIVEGLQRGGSYLATWQNVRLRGGAGQVTASRMQLRLQAVAGDGAARLVHVALTLDGVAGRLKPPTLLPDRLALRVTLPASSLPTLLAATGGGAPDAQIPVTVDDLSILSGPTAVHGQGDATAAATPMDSTARLHVTAQNYDDLVEQAAVRGLTRLHTALFLSRLMGRRAEGGLDWDVSFADGLLAVNNVPIPLR